MTPAREQPADDEEETFAALKAELLGGERAVKVRQARVVGRGQHVNSAMPAFMGSLSAPVPMTLGTDATSNPNWYTVTSASKPVTTMSYGSLVSKD